MLVNVLDANGDPTGRTIGQEALYGGAITLGSGLGAVSTGGGIFGSSNGGEIVARTDTGVGNDWTDISFDQTNFVGETHVFQHGLLFDNPTYTQSSPYVSYTLNDGGIYQLSYQSGFLVQGAKDTDKPSFFGDATWLFDALDPDHEPNRNLRISEFYKAEFAEINAGVGTNQNVVRIIGSAASNGIIGGIVDYTGGVVKSIVWSPLAFNFAPMITNDTDFPSGVVIGTDGNALNDPDNVRFAFASDPGLFYEEEVDNIAIDPNDLTGQTQYLTTVGDPTIPWGNPNRIGGVIYKRLYYTTDNWATYMDITPDRYLTRRATPIYAFEAPAPKTNARVYVFNRLVPQDTAVPNAWTGETRPYIGMPIAFGFSRQVLLNGTTNAFIPNPATTMLPPFNGAPDQIVPADQPCMYTGGQYLWRYDPVGSLGKLAVPPGPLGTAADPAAPAPPYGYEERVFPNKDRGAWRRVGEVQLASGTDYITAIAVVPGGRRGPDQVYVARPQAMYGLPQTLARLKLTRHPLRLTMCRG